MTAFSDINEGSTSAFEGFATFIDDDNLPGFDSLNKSSFFDQVMNTSKLFDGDISSAKLNESLSKLNESFSKMSSEPFTVKSAARMNRNKGINSRNSNHCGNDLPSTSFHMTDSIDEGEETENTTDEAFEDEILCAFLQNKLKKKQKEEQEKLEHTSTVLGMAKDRSGGEQETSEQGESLASKLKAKTLEQPSGTIDDAQSVTTATASLASADSIISSASANTSASKARRKKRSSSVRAKKVKGGEGERQRSPKMTKSRAKRMSSDSQRRPRRRGSVGGSSTARDSGMDSSGKSHLGYIPASTSTSQGGKGRYRRAASIGGTNLTSGSGMDSSSGQGRYRRSASIGGTNLTSKAGMDSSTANQVGHQPMDSSSASRGGHRGYRRAASIGGTNLTSGAGMESSVASSQAGNHSVESSAQTKVKAKRVASDSQRRRRRKGSVGGSSTARDSGMDSSRASNLGYENMDSSAKEGGQSRYHRAATIGGSNLSSGAGMDSSSANQVHQPMDSSSASPGGGHRRYRRAASIGGTNLTSGAGMESSLAPSQTDNHPEESIAQTKVKAKRIASDSQRRRRRRGSVGGSSTARDSGMDSSAASNLGYGLMDSAAKQGGQGRYRRAASIGGTNLSSGAGMDSSSAGNSSMDSSAKNGGHSRYRRAASIGGTNLTSGPGMECSMASARTGNKPLESCEQTKVKAKRVSSDSERCHRQRRRASSIGKTNLSSDAGMDCSSRMDSSGRNRMDKSASRSHSRGSDRHKGRFDQEETPLTPRRAQRMRDRSQSVGKAGNDDKAANGAPVTPKKSKSMDLRRVTRTPRGGRQSLCSDIMKRNLQIIDRDLDEPDAAASSLANPLPEQKKKHEVWKQRRSRSFGDPSLSFAAQQKNAALERAEKLQAATASLMTPRSAATKLSANAFGALDRISAEGLIAKESVRSSATSVSSADDSRLLLSAPNTPTGQRRQRRRGSCI